MLALLFLFTPSRLFQAHPYLDCWWTARSRFLQGRSEEIEARSREIYEQRIKSCEPGTTGEDWFKAETMMIQDIYKNKVRPDARVSRAHIISAQPFSLCPFPHLYSHFS